MSRGIKDLRDLICVSRLTVRESDDEILSDEEIVGKEFDSLSISSDSSTDGRQNQGQSLNQRVVSPDSGFATNGSPNEITANSKTGPNALSTPVVKSQTKSGKRRRKKKVLETFPSRHDLPKPYPLPPVQAQLSADNAVSSVPESLSKTDVSKSRNNGNFDDMLCYMDATIVSAWLTRANTSVSELAHFCHTGDNFVQFAHFWLSNFADLQKQEIFEMEYEILMEEISLAFSVGREQRKVVHSDIASLASALLVEYPSKLLSSKGPHLFLNYLDVLSSEKKEQYKHLLSNVRCSTRNRQYAQWLLATRSFALINIWCAVTNFYRNLSGENTSSTSLALPSSVSKQDISYQRMYQALRLGYVDVVHYLIVSGHVKPHHLDVHNRSLIFTAVMHNQEKVLQYLLTRVHPPINPNQPADTGNTPLHAASNSGHAALVKELLLCPDVDINATNPQCEQATPLHLAVMHGHKNVVELLMEAKADTEAKMGDMTPADIARDFGKSHLLEVLQR